MPVTQLRDTIASQLIGRDREAHLISLALIAHEHVLLVGPPGTAKSHLCRTSAHAIEGANYFERLLSPTTPPEAIFGPISISEFKQDRYVHVSAGYLPTAHVAYLDEVGRASAAISDTLLHILGPERQALIGTEQVKVPLIAAIGSANTWPEDAALMDRWLIRATVNYLTPSHRRALLKFAAPVLAPCTTLAEIKAAHTLALSLAWDVETDDTLDLILSDLDEAGITVSDRRLRASIKIAAACAVLNGHTSVQPIDLEPLQFVLWSVPEQAASAAAKIVGRANPLGAKIDELLITADEVVRAAIDAPTRLEAATKLESLLKEAKAIVKQGGNGKAAKVVKYIEREHQRVQARALGISEDRIAKMFAE
jgi:MoxR-like ATPase